MSVRRIKHEAPSDCIQLTVVTGGETAESSLGDAVYLEPFPGRYEDVEMRGVFAKDGRMRFSAADMREALKQVEELRTQAREGD